MNLQSVITYLYHGVWNQKASFERVLRALMRAFPESISFSREFNWVSMSKIPMFIFVFFFNFLFDKFWKSLYLTYM